MAGAAVSFQLRQSWCTRARVVFSPHLFMGDGNESVFGELSHDVEIRPHVQLAADQHHFGIGTELLRLPLPLCIKSTRTLICCSNILRFSTRFCFLAAGICSHVATRALTRSARGVSRSWNPKLSLSI